MGFVHRTVRRRQPLDAGVRRRNHMLHPAVVVEIAALRSMQRPPCNVEDAGLNPGASTRRNVIFSAAWRAAYLRTFASGQRHARPSYDSAELGVSRWARFWPDSCYD